MKRIFPVLFLSLIFIACNNQPKTEQEKQEDSLDQVSDAKVEKVLQNDDSILKEKERELLEKYK